MRSAFFLTILLLSAVFFVLPIGVPIASATTYTSSSFQVIDPVISDGGGRSTSVTYQLERSVAQPAIGISNSLGFTIKAGFLYFSALTPTPTPTPTASVTPTPPGGGGPPSFIGPVTLPPIYLPPPGGLPIPVTKCGIADFNCDGKIDIADLSAYLYLTGYSPQSNPADLNQDGNISLADASILFYYWTEPSSFKLPTFATRPIVQISSPFDGLSESGQAGIIPQGVKKTFFGIQEEGISLIKKATSTIASLLNRIIEGLVAVISGFLRLINNIVQLR